jgi:SAM-dependent methyltransferase
MLPFSSFDARNYRMVDVRTGYGEWVSTYEQTIEDAMDIDLLDALDLPTWDKQTRAVDLGCGTGRTGAWLRRQGVGKIDGVDLTPQMLAVARQRGIFDTLVEADVTATGLPSASYDVVTNCLVDEHLPELGPLYREASRLTRPGATFVLVAFHPHFIMATGMPTHFTNVSGEPVAIATHVHLLSDHVSTGLRSGWSLVGMREGLVDERWLAIKPKWRIFRNHPVSVAYAWRRD